MPTPTRLCVLLRATGVSRTKPHSRRRDAAGAAEKVVPNPTATVRDPPIVATPHGGSDDGGE
jgi:hypothetical protein